MHYLRFFSVIFLLPLFIFANEIKIEKPQDIFVQQNPFAFYRNALTPFELTSIRKFSKVANENQYEKDGETSLKINESGDFFLYRKIFSSPHGANVLYSKGDTFIRFDNEKNEKHVKFNPEFQRWLELSINEIIHLFKEADFDQILDEKKPEKMDSWNCWNNGKNRMCFDSKTYLPMEGYLQMKLPSNSTIELSFEIKKIAPGKLKIEKTLLTSSIKILNDGK